MVEFDLPAVENAAIRVFTTRPDTLFGATFMVLAPEHPLVAKLTSPERKADVDAYVARARASTEIERLGATLKFKPLWLEDLVGLARTLLEVTH